MHGDYHKNKRFSEEYLTEFTECFSILAAIVFIALIVGIVRGDVNLTISPQSRTGGLSLSTASLHQVGSFTEDVTRSSDRQHGPPTEGRPSSIDRKDKP